MKLRLQLAEMLPASPKPGADASHGDGAFSTAMEAMMASSVSGKPSLVGTPIVLSAKQPPMGMHPETAKPYQSVDIPAAEIHAANQVSQLVAPFATMPQQQVEQKGLAQVQDSQGQSGQHPDAQAPLPSEQPLPEEAKQSIDARALLLENSAVQRLHASPQSPAGATSPDATAIKSASSHAKHKSETMPDEPTQPADGRAADALPVISQPIDVVLPIPTLQLNEPAPQPDGSPSASLKPSSRAASGHPPGQDASGQAHVSAAALSHGDLRTPPVATPGSLTPGYLTLPQSPATAASKGGKPPESVPSNGKSENSTNAHLTAQPTGRARANVVVPPNQALHPQAAPSTDTAETNAKQADIRAPKEAEKKAAPDVKSKVRFNAADLLTPTPLAPQHQMSPNLSPAMTAGAEKPIATHRPEAGAAQVLQKMDLGAPSGAVQLRSDARRLDVGVSSGSLGWVEVRATTSASGRVDATLHVQNDTSAQVLTSQSREISDYAREHSVQLGQVSVGVGTGDSAQGQSHSTDARDGDGTRARGTAALPIADTEQTYHAADVVSLISVRA
jgi:hypothetical protein